MLFHVCIRTTVYVTTKSHNLLICSRAYNLPFCSCHGDQIKLAEENIVATQPQSLPKYEPPHSDVFYDWGGTLKVTWLNMRKATVNLQVSLTGRNNINLILEYKEKSCSFRTLTLPAGSVFGFTGVPAGVCGCSLGWAGSSTCVIKNASLSTSASNSCSRSFSLSSSVAMGGRGVWRSIVLKRNKSSQHYQLE